MAKPHILECSDPQISQKLVTVKGSLDRIRGGARRAFPESKASLEAADRYVKLSRYDMQINHTTTVCVCVCVCVCACV